MNARHAPIAFGLAISRRVTGATTAIFALSLAACADAPQTYEIGGRAMGTTYTVRIVADTGEPAFSVASLTGLIHTELHALEDVFSTYRPESEVSRFNAYPGQDWFPVSPVFLDVLNQAMEVSKFSGGAFDVTVGPLVDLWGFGASGGTGWTSPGEAYLEPPGDSGRIAIGDAGGMPRDDAGGTPGGDTRGMPAGNAARPPAREDVERLLAVTGFSRWQIRESPPAVRRLLPGVQLDFSGIAKGYAVDRLWSLLSEAGLSSYLVEIGGEVRSRGTRADGRAWSIGIENPDRTVVAEAVPLRDAAIATSGDYRNYFEHEGRRYSHVLDPRTGWPVSHGLTSVTVIASSAASADALATALLVLGPDTGFQLAVDGKLAARLVARTAEGLKVLPTPAYEAAFRH